MDLDGCHQENPNMQRSEKLKAQKIHAVDDLRVVRAPLVCCASKSHGACKYGSGLLERIRGNRLIRIRNLPFYLPASDNLPGNG